MEAVSDAVRTAPATARVLAGWLCASYLLSIATGGAVWLALIPGRTLPPHMYVWNLVTAPWVEHTVVGAAVDASALLVMGGVAEKLWGKAEFVRFVLLVPTLANVATFVFVILWFATTRNESVLFALLGGFTAGTGGLTVALKQLLPERPIPVFSSLLPATAAGPPFCARHLPAAFLAFKILDAAFFSHSVLTLVEGAAGVLVAWIYLRFYQTHASGARGDFSDSFAFDSFFPDAMQPAVSALGAIVFRALVACHICAPRASMVDSTGEYQAVPGSALDAIRTQNNTPHLDVASADHVHGGGGWEGVAEVGGGGDPAGAESGPGADVLVAQRRRETALKILEGRLERMAASDQ